MNKLILFSIVIFLSTNSLLCSAETVNINWKVTKPFRFIASKSAYEKYSFNFNEKALEFVNRQVGEKQRANLPPIDSTVWLNNSSELFRTERDHFFPKHGQVEAELVNNVEGICSWTYQEQKGEVLCNTPFTFYAVVNADVSPILKITIPSGNTISETISIKDRLLLGLGDSYASGESNPDIPAIADFNKLEAIRLETERLKNSETGRWLHFTDNWLKRPARWLDKQCHRSMLSQHVLTAMRLAEINPHESISLLPLACSGAEMMDGVLVPQENPPGDSGKPNYTNRTGKNRKRTKINYSVSESQVNLAIRHLCDGDVQMSKKRFSKREPNVKVPSIEAKVLRCNGKIREPDAILISIGGNDVGFSSSIAWAALPKNGRHILGGLAVKVTHLASNPICPHGSISNPDDSCTVRGVPTSNDRVRDWLPGYYQELNNELRDSKLLTDSSNVYLTAYPNPLFSGAEKKPCHEASSEDALEQVRSQLPKAFNTQKWSIRMKTDETSALNLGLFEPLSEMMESRANIHGWNFIDAHVKKISEHGICAGFKRTSSKQLYPHPDNGVWIPKSPDLEWAYDNNRERWIRNTNDSVLFQADGTPAKSNGAFHPDARGHALVADALYDAITMKWRNLSKDISQIRY